jgi:hypothetical protein
MSCHITCAKLLSRAVQWPNIGFVHRPIGTLGNPAARQMRAVIVSISANSFTSRRPSDLRLHVVFHMRNDRTVRAVSPFD